MNWSPLLLPRTTEMITMKQRSQPTFPETTLLFTASAHCGAPTDIIIMRDKQCSYHRRHYNSSLDAIEAENDNRYFSYSFRGSRNERKKFSVLRFMHSEENFHVASNLLEARYLHILGSELPKEPRTLYYTDYTTMRLM